MKSMRLSTLIQPCLCPAKRGDKSYQVIPGGLIKEIHYTIIKKKKTKHAVLTHGTVLKLMSLKILIPNVILISKRGAISERNEAPIAAATRPRQSDRTSHASTQEILTQKGGFNEALTP